MKKIWIKAGLFSAALLALTGLCGCEKKEEKYVKQTNDAANISFSWWGNDARHIYTLNGLDVFQRKNTDIAVKANYSVWSGYEKRMKAYMESHTEADVMQINYAWLDMFSEDGEGFYDLYQLRDTIHLETYDQEDLVYGEVNGKLNAVPISFNTYTIYHNQDLYEKYGLELPKTWDDYFKAAEVMREDDVYPIGVVKKQALFLLISYFEQTTGQYVFADDGTFLLSEEDMEFLLEFYARLLEEKVIMPTADYETDRFVAQQTATAYAWVTDANTLCDDLMATGVNVTIGDLPRAEDAKLYGQYIKPSCMYAISKNTEHPKEAGRLLRFLINSNEMTNLQGLEKGVPAGKNSVKILSKAKKLEGILYEAHQKMQEERSNMRLIVPSMEMDNMIDLFKQEADDYLFGKADIHTCAKKICAGIRALCNK